ncbi:uncharacterized protein RCC_08731 [Ramularia collo-cygni]|uniref:Uncharacterized protein n=1 Tax=Ramularia collo-cygni TaxID=112498 RepID=A0A2D3VFU9_9PEZI|nr:uncharacterized protein RCC_08731 [Ramularia collo-cygni]CZT23021.1 uncharacterized protein RCC_08731 [Ramularia collo-cygni]
MAYPEDGSHTPTIGITGTLSNDQGNAGASFEEDSTVSYIHDTTAVATTAASSTNYLPSAKKFGTVKGGMPIMVAKWVSPLSDHVTESQYGEVTDWTASAAHASRIISIPRASWVMKAQRDLQAILGLVFGAFKSQLFLDKGTERLAAAEDALRAMQAEPEHLQTAVKVLRNLSNFPPGAGLEVDSHKIRDIDEDSPSDVLELPTLPEDKVAALFTLDDTIYRGAQSMIEDQVKYALPRAAVMQSHIPFQKNNTMKSNHPWELSEFKNDPLLWARSRLNHEYNPKPDVVELNVLDRACNVLFEFVYTPSQIFGQQHFARNMTGGNEALAAAITETWTMSLLLKPIENARPARPET